MAETVNIGGDSIKMETDTETYRTTTSATDSSQNTLYTKADSAPAFIIEIDYGKTEDSQERSSRTPPNADWDSLSQEKDKMTQSATNGPHKSFRDFLGISAVSSGALLIFFVGLFLQGSIQSPVMAVLGTILLVATAGFIRTWFVLRQ